MAKKINYTGSSKIIKRICEAINDLIDSGGGGGSNVTIEPSLSSGTKIADYSIDDTPGVLYAPTPPVVHNVPAGGSTNQVLAKNSATDYDLKWVNQSGGGGGQSPLYYDQDGYICIDYDLLEVR